MSMDMWHVKLKDESLYWAGCNSYRDTLECAKNSLESCRKGGVAYNTLKESYEEMLKLGCRFPSEDWTQWDNVTSDNVEDLLPEGNYYKHRGFEDPSDFEYCLLENIYKMYDEKFDFTGDPVCSRETYAKATSLLLKWYDEVFDGKDVTIAHEGCVDDNGDTYTTEMTAKQVKDFVEFMTLANDNGFTMWFSF